MKRTIVTPPAVEPVVAEDLREQLNFDSTEKAAFMAGLLQTAREDAEERLWQRLITQTWDQWFDDFGCGRLDLELSPVQSITSLKYLDVDGVLQTLSPDVYELGECHGIGFVRLKKDQQWPTTYGVEDCIVVRHVVGYGAAASDVPARIRSAIKLHAAHYFLNRGGESMPSAFADLLDPISSRRSR
jgi:uncharacterized phiE125 gp8 family phage protein